MGRRSINTTKSGKYMNPTDQARKEARKKELKKNKKQRQMVRAAVLKNKDPSQILEEMEKIDEMEYDVLQPSPLNEKVLRDKRKKLKETFDRVMRLYHTEDPEHWAELKHKELEYEKNRLKKQQYCESVKHAQSVQIDEIPLPSSNEMPNDPIGVPMQISGEKRIPLPPTALSLPPFAPSAPPGTLRKSTENLSNASYKTVETFRKELMGVPSGPPPDLLEMHDLNSDVEDEEVVLKKYMPKSKCSKTAIKPNNLQKRILAISGQNIDEFMKEMEHVYKNREQDSLETNAEKQKFAEEYDISNSEESTKDNIAACSKHAPPTPTNASVAPAAGPISVLNASLPTLPAVASGMIFRPPIIRPPAMHNFGVRVPAGPPPNVRHHAINGMPRMGIRIPGPPPGLPRPLHQQQPKSQHNPQGESKGITTITAKPQIRNLSADVTRFVPSTLRVKREEVRKQVRSKLYVSENTSMGALKSVSKDDAYIQFMNEMQGLL